MRVRAIEPGFYGGNLISVGTNFDVPDGHSGSWFVSADKPAPKLDLPPADEPMTLGEFSKAQGASGKTFIEYTKKK